MAKSESVTLEIAGVDVEFRILAWEPEIVGSHEEEPTPEYLEWRAANEQVDAMITQFDLADQIGQLLIDKGRKLRQESKDDQKL